MEELNDQDPTMDIVLAKADMDANADIPELSDSPETEEAMKRRIHSTGLFARLMAAVGLVVTTASLGIYIFRSTPDEYPLLAKLVILGLFMTLFQLPVIRRGLRYDANELQVDAAIPWTTILIVGFCLLGFMVNYPFSYTNPNNKEIRTEYNTSNGTCSCVCSGMRLHCVPVQIIDILRFFVIFFSFSFCYMLSMVNVHYHYLQQPSTAIFHALLCQLKPSAAISIQKQLRPSFTYGMVFAAVYTISAIFMLKPVVTWLTRVFLPFVHTLPFFAGISSLHMHDSDLANAKDAVTFRWTDVLYEADAHPYATAYSLMFLVHYGMLLVMMIGVVMEAMSLWEIGRKINKFTARICLHQALMIATFLTIATQNRNHVVACGIFTANLVNRSPRDPMTFLTTLEIIFLLACLAAVALRNDVLSFEGWYNKTVRQIQKAIKKKKQLAIDMVRN